MTLNVELLESSFVQVKSNSSEFTEQFYRFLFADYPEVQSLFANTNMEKQGKQLFQSILFTVNHLRQPEVLSSALQGLGTRHVQYGVLPEHYPMVGNSLLKAFEARLGTAWTINAGRCRLLTGTVEFTHCSEIVSGSIWLATRLTIRHSIVLNNPG
jgi:hemoglobin-like flavoprotein